MVNFTAYYWRHMCPAESPEDGNVIYHSGKIDFLERKFKDVSEFMGSRCSVKGCNYTLNEETVLLNEAKEEIRTLGGKNLYPDRLRADRMKCCKWFCMNKSTSGHSVYNPTHREFGNHRCPHAFEYIYVLHNYPTKKRLEKCRCVMINQYDEEIASWEPDGQERVPVPGGPLDLDNEYHKKKEKEKEERDSAAVQK